MNLDQATTEQTSPVIVSGAELVSETVYFILCDFGNGRSWVERDPASMDFRSTVEDIATGQFDNVVKVLEVEGEIIAWDATKKIAKAVMTEWANRGEPLTDKQYEFVEQQVSVHAARSFRRVA